MTLARRLRFRASLMKISVDGLVGVTRDRAAAHGFNLTRKKTAPLTGAGITGKSDNARTGAFAARIGPHATWRGWHRHNGERRRDLRVPRTPMMRARTCPRR
jgi:hypothetical protein